ncbi:histidine kinase [Nocardiopsis sp. RSe5-2]|uniref:Histidine kinase n=1 Tax=Nocardiopsis endophytica TaxID=3018445 RepID=A0ABT4U334_9ACTN|nr:histidine kinase [Nocardiopsis endophytica]MDA2811367.1 histidine kinase [Nocardiopsis endophytica]
MDLTPYVDDLRRQLLAAAEAGGEDTRVIAERLSAALDPAARLALLDALSSAADEITRDVAPGSVEVRLRGGQADFIVTPPPSDPAPTGDAAPAAPRHHGDVTPEPAAAPPPEADDGGTSRITLRLPDRLKPRVEEAARLEGLSVNAWLVRAVGAALDPGARGTDRNAGRRVGRGYTGWVR